MDELTKQLATALRAVSQCGDRSCFNCRQRSETALNAYSRQILIEAREAALAVKRAGEVG